MNHHLPQDDPANRRGRPLFVPPRITTYTDDELLEAMGPAVAYSGTPVPSFLGTPDPFYDPNFTFPGEE